jgi:hypothetical protein
MAAAPRSGEVITSTESQIGPDPLVSVDADRLRKDVSDGRQIRPMCELRPALSSSRPIGRVRFHLFG